MAYAVEATGLVKRRRSGRQTLELRLADPAKRAAAGDRLRVSDVAAAIGGSASAAPPHARRTDFQPRSPVKPILSLVPIADAGS